MVNSNERLFTMDCYTCENKPRRPGSAFCSDVCKNKSNIPDPKTPTTAFESKYERFKDRLNSMSPTDFFQGDAFDFMNGLLNPISKVPRQLDADRAMAGKVGSGSSGAERNQVNTAA